MTSTSSSRAATMSSACTSGEIVATPRNINPHSDHRRCEHAQSRHMVGRVQHSSEELNASAPNGRPATLGDLKASGHLYRTVKQEIRENLLTRMRAGEN